MKWRRKIERVEARFGRLIWDKGLAWWMGGGASLPLFDGATVDFHVPLESSGDPFAPFPGDILDAADQLLALRPAAKQAVTAHVWANYSEQQASSGEHAVIAPDDIWRHVRPQTIGFERRVADERVYASIHCRCDWEREHGLELVLLGGVRWVKVGQHDGQVTDGDAFNAPSLDAWMADPAATLPLRSYEDCAAAGDAEALAR